MVGMYARGQYWIVTDRASAVGRTPENAQPTPHSETAHRVTASAAHSPPPYTPARAAGGDAQLAVDAQQKTERGARPLDAGLVT